MPNSPLATGAQTRFSLVKEALFGVVPANPAFKSLRPFALTIDPKPVYTQSKEFRTDVMRAGQILVGKQVTAKYSSELSLGTNDDILESGCRSAWVKTAEIVKAVAEIASVAVAGVYNVAAGLGTPFKVGHLVSATNFLNAANNVLSRVTANAANSVTLGGAATVAEAVPPVGARLKVVGLRAAANGSVNATAGATNKITVATTDPGALGLVAGMLFRASGFTGTLANNGWYRVLSITGAGPWDITCDIVPNGFATDAAAGQIVSLFYTDYLRPAATRTSFAAEEAHLDNATFKYVTGLVPSKVGIKLSPESIIDLDVEFDGVSGDWGPQAVGATYAPKTTNDPYNTSSNIGGAYVNGAWVQGVVTAADLTINTGAKVDKALGVFGAADIHFGAWSIDGSIEKYFLDTVVALRVMQGLPTGILLPVFDAISGSGYAFDIRRAKLMDGNNPAVQNSDDALKEPYKFQAEVDPTIGYMFHLQKIEAYA